VSWQSPPSHQTQEIIGRYCKQTGHILPSPLLEGEKERKKKREREIQTYRKREREKKFAGRFLQIVFFLCSFMNFRKRYYIDLQFFTLKHSVKWYIEL
jgi:hypothetical protein